MGGQGLEIACRSPMAALAKEGMAVLVDIGGTVDPVVLQYGVPQPFEDEHPARGTIWTYNSIRRDIKAKTGADVPEEAVNLYLNGENIRMDETSVGIFREHIDHYANRLLMELREKGLPFATAYTLVQGGGAKFVRDAWKQLASFAMAGLPAGDPCDGDGLRGDRTADDAAGGAEAGRQGELKR